MTEVPAGPLLHVFDERRKSFKTLRGLASVEIRKWGRKQVLENVGIVLDGAKRLRIEAYGPLGQSLMTVVWDGRTLLYRLAPDDEVKQGREGLNKIIGEEVDPAALAAALSGNIPVPAKKETAALFCSDINCVLEFKGSDVTRKVFVSVEQPPKLLSEELNRVGKLLYRVQFRKWEPVSKYLLPMQIDFESAETNAGVSIQYHDVEVNTPISKEAFKIEEN